MLLILDYRYQNNMCNIGDLVWNFLETFEIDLKYK